ncbi:MAG: hypothetical protein ACOX3U_01830 [Christensenellales bacterium]
MRRLFKLGLTAILILIMIASLYSCNPSRVRKDTVFYIDVDNSTIMDAPFNAFIDPSSNVTLRKDGTATLYLRIRDDVTVMLNSLLQMDEVKNFDIKSVIHGMAQEYLPGFDLADMESTLEKVDASINVKLLGFDFDDPEIVEMFTQLNETGQIPANIKIPKGLGIEYTAGYELVKVHSDYTGNDYTAVYIGEKEPNGEPYTIMTLNDKGDEIYFRIEMIQMTLIAKAK